ncbi:hypothetical protein BDV12DRAFT_188598 [Aspergillus spectabilis]
MSQTQVDLLQYLRSKTQVDLDTFDVTVIEEFGQCVDCTSNQHCLQFEYYNELAKPSRNDILQKAAGLAAKHIGQFPGVRVEELAVEVAAVLLGLEMLPAFTGNLHVMANPEYAYSKRKVVETGKRYHKLFGLIDPFFPTSRLVMKVPATWEGIQACRDLRAASIKTLATTVFTMEQAVLAGEVGCVSISPFVHELKVIFDESYRDNHLINLCVQAQRWYEQNSLPTKVKACATVGVNEILQLAGVAAFTIIPDDLRVLQSTHKDADELARMSLFNQDVIGEAKREYGPYVDDEAKYRIDFARADEGQAQMKLGQAIHIFCDFQAKAEALILKSIRPIQQ